MKCFFFLAVLAYGAAALKSVGVSFGPKNCVMLSRSSGGSCVLTTDCEGVDTTKTEFAFDCVGQGVNADIVRHSFGVGGFEASEEFDTEVKCGRCASATEASAAKPTVKKVKAILKPAAVPKPAAAAPVKPKKVHTEEIPGAVAFSAKANTAVKTEAKAKFWPFTSSKKKEEKPEAVEYGPNGCVSVYKNGEGHCIMNTDCEKSDLSNYEFGLVCVDKTGSPVKHLFGKDSFDAKESFDTLIKCDQCLGLEDVPDSVALAGEVATMGKEIAGLKAVLKNISINVQMLNKEVFPPKAAAPAPAPEAAAPAPAAPVKLMSHQAVSHHHKHRGNLRRSHRHHRHHRRDDDDDDDDDDREDDREEQDFVEPANPQPVQYVAAPVAPVVPMSQPIDNVQQGAASIAAAANAAGSDDDEDDEGNDED